MCKEVTVSNVKCYPETFLKLLRKTTQIFSGDSGFCCLMSDEPICTDTRITFKLHQSVWISITEL